MTPRQLASPERPYTPAVYFLIGHCHNVPSSVIDRKIRIWYIFLIRKSETIEFVYISGRSSCLLISSHPGNSLFRIPTPGEKMALTLNMTGGIMEVSDLKKILAGFCIAGLITGSTFVISGCDSAHSAWSGEKAGAGSSKSGWSGGTTGAGGTDDVKEEKPAKSGWGG